MTKLNNKNEIRGIYITQSMALVRDRIKDEDLRNLYTLHLINSQLKRVKIEGQEGLDGSVVDFVEYQILYDEVIKLMPHWTRMDVLEGCYKLDDLGFIMVSLDSFDTADDDIYCYMPHYYDLENEEKFEVRSMYY